VKGPRCFRASAGERMVAGVRSSDERAGVFLDCRGRTEGQQGRRGATQLSLEKRTFRKNAARTLFGIRRGLSPVRLSKRLTPEAMGCTSTHRTTLIVRYSKYEACQMGTKTAGYHLFPKKLVGPMQRASRRAKNLLCILRRQVFCRGKFRTLMCGQNPPDGPTKTGHP